jgi:cyanate permease
MVGMAAGAILMPPIAQRLITALGWRSAYAAFGILSLAVSIPLVALFLRDSPREIGFLPDGAVDPLLPSEHRPEKQGLIWREARSTATFWLMLPAFALVGASVHACVIHLPFILTDRGISAETAALASSAFGIALLLARIASGYILDRAFAPYVAMFFFIGVACGLFLLSSGAGRAAAFLGAFLVGMGMGAEGDLIAYFASRYFGLRSFGEIYGYLFAAFTLSGALGPLLMAVGFDRAGSYRLPILFFVALTITATVLIARLGPYRYRPA